MAKKPKTPSLPRPEDPEPEGGPEERARAFLEERLTPLQKRPEETPPKSPSPAPQPHVDQVPEAGKEPPSETSRGRASRRPRPQAESVSPPARPNRRKLIEQYRERQDEETTRRQSPPKPRSRLNSLSAPPPPAAPAAPPANNWIPIGPSVVRQGQGGVKPATSGRTPAIAPVTGGNRCYIGAANGGVWRTEDGGANWLSLMDAFDLNPLHQASDSLAIGALAVIAGASPNTDRIYVGSGEGPGGAYFGVGPIISTDGGQNWNTEPARPGAQNWQVVRSTRLLWIRPIRTALLPPRDGDFTGANQSVRVFIGTRKHRPRRGRLGQPVWWLRELAA